MFNSGQTPYSPAAMEQQQALLKALMGGATEIPQATGRTSVAELLKPLGMALGAKLTQKRIGDLEQQKLAASQADMAKVLTAYQGSEGQPGGKDALIQALLSVQNPEMQKTALTMLAQTKPTSWKLGTVGADGDKQQSIFYNEADPTQTRPVGAPVRKGQLPDWMLPGYIETKRAVAQAESTEKPLSATAQKELFESDELAQTSGNVISMLNEAKKLNAAAMSGPYATTRAKAMSLLPGDNAAADATINLDNIMTGQALESLKATFGGMPTEGERKILLDMQASADKTPKQREEIMNRAIAAAERRLKFNQDKAKSLREGSYFKQSPAQQPPAAGGIKFLGFE